MTGKGTQGQKQQRDSGKKRERERERVQHTAIRIEATEHRERSSRQ